MIRISARLAAVMLATMPLPALACSVVEGYRAPTNLELAQNAELILLGKVTGAEGGNPEEPWNDRLLVEPLLALKGDLPDGPVKLPGMSLVDQTGFLVLSNPFDFVQAHPLSYIGGCIRYMFPQGGTVLFFLNPAQTPGSWQPAGGPFSRWAEDELRDGGPWTALAAIYAAAADLPENERVAMLELERAVLAERKDDPVTLLMAEDIARQIAGPEAVTSDDSNEQGPSAVDAALEAMRAGEDE